MTTAFHIRPFRDEDTAAILTLWEQCGLTAPHNDPRKDIARKKGVNPEWFLVGELDGAIAASCMVGYEGHRGWINYLAVGPELRGRGFGRALVGEAERILTAAGCPKVNLQIRATNAKVIAFYERLGFQLDTVASMGKRLIPDETVTFDALSIVSPAGKRIASGAKTLEIRSWLPPRLPLTDLLIVENGKRLNYEGDADPDGFAVALVDVHTVRPWTPEDAARDGHTYMEGYHAWELTNVRALRPIPARAERLIYKVTLSPGQL